MPHISHSHSTCHVQCTPTFRTFCLYFLRFVLLLNKAHKFTLVFVTHIYYVARALSAKSMPCIHTPTHIYTDIFVACHTPRESLRRPGANFIIYSLTRRGDDNVDYVPLGEAERTGAWQHWGGNLLILIQMGADNNTCTTTNNNSKSNSCGSCQCFAFSCILCNSFTLWHFAARLFA